MSGPPLPRGAAGETFFDQGPHFQRLARVFAWLAAEPGIGVVTGEPGVGKTSAMRHLCRALPQHEHRVVYLADTTVKPLDLYRMLAAELGLRPGPRAQLVGDIKRALVPLVDQRGVVPLILDDAQALRDEVLHELHALTTLDFDDREYLTIWLVGHPRLDRRLHLQQHAALAQHVVAYTQLSASTDPALFGAMLDHALAVVGAPPDLVTPDAPRTAPARLSRHPQAHQLHPPDLPHRRRRAQHKRPRSLNRHCRYQAPPPRPSGARPRAAAQTPLRSLPKITWIARPDTHDEVNRLR